MFTGLLFLAFLGLPLGIAMVGLGLAAVGFTLRCQRIAREIARDRLHYTESVARRAERSQRSLDAAWRALSESENALARYARSKRERDADASRLAFGDAQWHCSHTVPADETTQAAAQVAARISEVQREIDELPLP
jgi:hypothetical protein